MKTEEQYLKELLEGQTITIVTVKIGAVEVEPMIVAEKFDGSHLVTSEGTYTSIENCEIDYKDRSITVKNVGDNVVSRTFVVLNLNPKKGRHYQPYPSTEVSSKWLTAEEASWNWPAKTPT